MSDLGRRDSQCMDSISFSKGAPAFVNISQLTAREKKECPEQGPLSSSRRFSGDCTHDSKYNSLYKT